MNTHEIAGENQSMRVAGFTGEPSFCGYTRWTHKRAGVLAIRQPWMQDDDWAALLKRKIEQSRVLL